MQKEFSRRDFLKGMAVVTASGLLVACGGGNGTPVKLAFVAMDNFYDQDETLNSYVLCQGFQVKNLSASDITLEAVVVSCLLLCGIKFALCELGRPPYMTHWGQSLCTCVPESVYTSGKV